MRCDRCSREAVLFQEYSGLRLCGDHAMASLESRAKRLIRARRWIRPGDRIAIGLSGGPCSSSLLHFLSVNFGMRRDLSLVAITVDDGPVSGGCTGMSRARRIAEGMGVEWEGTGIQGERQDLPREIRLPGSGEGHPSLHPGLRDHALVSLASSVGATRLALGTSLDTLAKALFLDVVQGEAPRLMGDPDEGGEGIPLILPFSRIPGEELLLYARLNGIDCLPGVRPGTPGSFEEEAGRMLAGYTRRHPSTLFSLANMAESLGGQGQPGTGERFLPGRRHRETAAEGDRGTRHG
jgi:tRNA(Ile)-lysidine synthase TilS/MesJ